MRNPGESRMKIPLTALLTLAFLAGPGLAQTTTTETQKEKKQHEIACVAGTVTGAVLGAAVGGIFGNGVGRTLMEVAGAGGGGFAGHRLGCRQ
jgi:uncharacterized protein YcfJ